MARTSVEDEFLHYTGKAGDLSRQFGLAGIAVIWLFHTATGAGAQIPRALQLPVYLIFASLALDLLQYIFGACSWGFLVFQDKGQDPGDAHKARLGMILAFIMLKIMAMMAAYGVLLWSLMQLISWR